MTPLDKKSNAEVLEIYDIYDKCVKDTENSIIALEKALELDRRRLRYFNELLTLAAQEMDKRKNNGT